MQEEDFEAIDFCLKSRLKRFIHQTKPLLQTFPNHKPFNSVLGTLPKSHHLSTILPVFNLAWDSHGGYFPECCWSFNRGDWGVFSISPVQIINQIFGIILIFDNDTTVKRIIEIGNDQWTRLKIKLGSGIHGPGWPTFSLELLFILRCCDKSIFSISATRKNGLHIICT